MGVISSRVRTGAQDAYAVIPALPASPDWHNDLGTIDFGNSAGNTVVGFLQFKPDLPAGTTINSARLRLTAAADYSGVPGTHTVGLLNQFDQVLSDNDIDLVALQTDSEAADNWEAGNVYELDVTDLIAAGLAHASYDVAKYITLSISSDEAALRSVRSVDGDFLAGPELLIDYTLATPPASQVTPSELVLRGLWWMLEASPAFGALVPTGNRLKFLGSDRDPIKQEMATADYPEVRILQTSCQPQYDKSSSSSFVIERFEVQVRTGDKSKTTLWYPLKWAIIRALRPWREVLMKLRWNNRQFVHLLNPLAMTEGLALNRENGQILGWAGVWGCEVHLNFPTAEL